MALEAKYQRFAILLAEGKEPQEALRIVSGRAASRATAKLWAAMPEVQRIVRALQQRAMDAASVTVDSLIGELEEAREVGRSEGQAGPMVQASVAKGKLVGLMTEKVELTGTVRLQAVGLDFSKLTVQELKALRDLARKLSKPTS